MENNNDFLNDPNEPNSEIEELQQTPQDDIIGDIDDVDDLTPTDKPAGKEKKKIDPKREIREWAIAIIFALLITFSVKGFALDIVMVDGHSMETTLMDQNRLVLTKFGYTPKAGDIIVLDSNYKAKEQYIESIKEKSGDKMNWFKEMQLKYFPPDSFKPKYYVKRVIAMPGDVIDFDRDSGKVIVNGNPLDEPYINGVQTRAGNSHEYPYTVEPNHVFVMGDNRNNSSDSRSSLGTVPFDAILGKASFRVWPLKSIGVIYH